MPRVYGVRLKTFLPCCVLKQVPIRAEVDKHPLDVLVYAARHDYSELLDKAASLVIGQPLDSVIDRMPPVIALVWVSSVLLLPDA